MEKYKGFLVIVILIVVGIGIWFVSAKIKDKNLEEDNLIVDNDTSNVTNVPVIDRKLGDDIDITQSYLMNYTIHKAGIWYMSEGYVKDVKKNNTSIVYTISNEDNTKSIKGSIISEDVYDKGTKVYFVGTINLGNGMLNLSTISNEVIDYSSPIPRELSEFVDHVDNVRNTNFIVHGYLVTDNEEYKLFDSKSDYQEDANAGNYFLLSMDESFNYTGNANVTLKCNINGTYNLRNCSLVQ